MELNILVQVLNIFIFFILFYKFFWNKIIEEIERRKNLIEKANKAEVIYNEMLEKAKLEREKIIKEWLELKEKIIKEAYEKAKMEYEKIIDKAKKDYDDIIKQWEQKIKNMEQELYNNFEKWLYITTRVVINKLFEDDEVANKYLDKILKDFKNARDNK